MNKFIVHTSRNGSVSIMEVEVELVSAIQDPSVMWLPKDEYRAKILHPESLHDPVLGPPIWYSHAFYASVAGALSAAEQLIQQQFEFVKRKSGVDFTADDVKQKALGITVKYL